MNIYMIVTQDKYELPLYWGSSIAELAQRAHMKYNTVNRGVWAAMRGEKGRTKYVVVRLPQKVWERLKAYEDTGLMPGDVEELIKMATSKTDKVLQLKEELQGAKNTAEQYAAINDTLYDSNMKLGADRKALINELCQYCGKYKHAHEGACDGCRWREK